MQIRKLAVVAAAVGAVGVSLLSASPASADYAPGSGDVVGVGSDTVQYVIDFLADGDYTGSGGYNSGKLNRVINFDATPDANARLAYGSYGLGSSTVGAGTAAKGATAATNFCGPGTGGTQGTGNANSAHTGDAPCVLNPTIVLRAGTRPVLRPNGSGAGFNALKADVANGTHLIDFARRSSAAGDTSGAYDSVNVGQDGLAMLSKTGGNAVALSAAQLKTIYECTNRTWTSVGGASASNITPILPQVGSGTRSSFLSAIGTTEGALGSCVVNAEENDPEAIDASGDPANSIEPMSSGRLAMFKGQDSTGASIAPAGVVSYFNDPSCQYGFAAAACKVTGGTAATLGNQQSPDVKYWTSGTPSTGSLFNITRNLYVYFRHADLNATGAFQPGTTRNWVRTFFYNPCSGTDYAGNPITSGVNCVSANQFGPGGAPWLTLNSGLVESAGVNTTSGSGVNAFGNVITGGA
jgi:ABC-type phosphate transport system substrate-binding protein